MSDDEVQHKISKFVKNLYNVVSNYKNTDIIWSYSGKSFIIPDREYFIANSLKYVSKTTEYTAFVRQLYLYGFSKLKTVHSSEGEFLHKYFQRNREDLLVYVTRKQATQIAVFTENSPQYQEFLQTLDNKNYKLENEVKDLQRRVSAQEKAINGLVELLSRMFTKNNGKRIHETLDNLQNINKSAHLLEDLSQKNQRRQLENKKMNYENSKIQLQHEQDSDDGALDFENTIF